MKSLLNRVWKEDEGVLTFEWILLITLLVIGIVGGLSAVRDAVITELGDVAQAVMSLDTSYRISSPWEVESAAVQQDGAAGSAYLDTYTFSESRGGTPAEQVPVFNHAAIAESIIVGSGDIY